jgi:hypothetical protein
MAVGPVTHGAAASHAAWADEEIAEQTNVADVSHTKRKLRDRRNCTVATWPHHSDRLRDGSRASSLMST